MLKDEQQGGGPARQVWGSPWSNWWCRNMALILIFYWFIMWWGAARGKTCARTWSIISNISNTCQSANKVIVDLFRLSLYPWCSSLKLSIWILNVELKLSHLLWGLTSHVTFYLALTSNAECQPAAITHYPLSYHHSKYFPFCTNIFSWFEMVGWRVFTKSQFPHSSPRIVSMARNSKTIKRFKSWLTVD